MARLQDFQSVTPTGSDNLLIVQSQGQGLSTLNAVGQKVAAETTMSSLTTTSKNLVGAVNEINANKVNTSNFNAQAMPIESGSSTNTKDYVDTEKVANTASYLYKPTVTEPTLSIGTNHNNRTWYYKHGTRVCLSIGLRDLSVGLINQDIFTLPVGYRPRKPLSLICCGYSFDKNSAVMITDAGVVRVAYTQDQGCFAYIEFDAYS